MRDIKKRINKLEQEQGQARTVIVVVSGAEEDEVAAHLARHPEDEGCNFIVVNTGIPRAPGDEPFGWCGAL